MSVLGSDELENNARGSLASQSDQQGGGVVFPPFSEELRVDGNLKLSRNNFIQSIEDFFKHKKITRLSQLKTTPPFPKPHVMAQFASKAYTDYKNGETDAQYEKKLYLPDGWKLLTTASNFTINNGYFGAAYWHPEHQWVVIAHRGTDTQNLGALWTDVKGVLFNNIVPQMESASTFAHKVVKVLQKVNRMNGVSFELFFTGHSLGGWLAQVTTFTTEHLKKVENLFLKSYDNDYCHPHTVVFESPGCKDMLLQMAHKLDVRLEGRSIDLEHLDVNCYLSAPNRINTCNAHLGTVYRIFPDVSDMGWWGKKTAFYNLATHSMDKIVQAFDPKTGQVYKDEQNRLKVQVVVDWPVSTGLKGGEEYNSFFDWAWHLNNYHPIITDVSFKHKHYYPFRYQTKIFHEWVNSLNVFTEEEQEFLQCYRWLRQWPEFFKPNELFAVMEDSQAQDEAEELLQTFKIERNKVYCTNALELQSLIPYVKRLLQLFPEIKGKTKCALLANEVRNRVYQFETRCYVELIRQIPLELSCDISSYREFLKSEQQKVLLLRMSDTDEWTRLLKVYKLLQKTGCLIEGQYTLLKLKRFLKLQEMMNSSTLMQSYVKQHFLLLSCENSQVLDDKTRNVIQKLFDTIKKNPNIKIIFISGMGDSTFAFLHHKIREISGKGLVRTIEDLTWYDLTASSQEKLLEKSVKFQGNEIHLNELMSVESPAAKFLPLGALVEEKELTIADPVPISNAYNKDYYIGRTLRQEKVIKQEICNDADVKSKRVFLANTEKEFKELCRLYPNTNVHWLEDKSGKLVWQQSKGSLEILRRYIDTDISHKYTDDDLDKLLEQASHQRVMLISDKAGMGKSTLLTHLSKQIKQNYKDKWVVRIDLNSHTDDLNDLKHQSKERAKEFVLQRLLKLKPGLEIELFKQCCEKKQKLRIVIMLDGVDEISPTYKGTVIDLLQDVRHMAVEQLWITTRPHLREQLEDKLQQLSYTLETFSKKNQIDFLTKYWSLNNWFTKKISTVEEECIKKLQVYAKELIKKVGNSINDKDRHFTGIPLQTRMLAEAFDIEIKEFYQSAESVPELEFQLDLVGLYRRIIERKFDIYQEEKCQFPVNNVGAKEHREREFEAIRKDHQLLALKVFFSKELVTVIQKSTECKLSNDNLTRIGIVQIRDDDKPHFIHRTFAEYYVADCLVNHMTGRNKTSQQVQTFILNDVFQKEDYRFVRLLIDGLLTRSRISPKILKEYGIQIHDLWNDTEKDDDDDDNGCDEDDDDDDYDEDDDNGCDEDDDDDDYDDDDNDDYDEDDDDDGESDSYSSDGDFDKQRRRSFSTPLLHPAVREGNVNIIGFVLDSAQAAENTDVVNKLLLEKDKKGHTAWHEAVFSNNIQVLQKLWLCFEGNQRAEELRREILFANNRRKMNAWQLAVRMGNVEFLMKQWELAKENLTREDLNKLLIATDGRRRTVLHLAAYYHKQGVFQEILKLAKEILTPEEVKKLLLATDNEEMTFFHRAAVSYEIEEIKGIFNLAKEHLKEEVKVLLLAKNFIGCMALYMDERFPVPTVEKLQGIFNLAKENLTKDDLKKILLASDINGQMLFWRRERDMDDGLLQTIFNLAEENLTKEELKKWLLTADNCGSTLFHVVGLSRDMKIFQRNINFCKENLTPEEIKKLLLTIDNLGNSVFHNLFSLYGMKYFQELLNFAKQNLTKEEVKKLLLAMDNNGRTVFQLITIYKYIDSYKEVFNLAKEYLTDEEVPKLLLDNKGWTVFHDVAYRYKYKYYINTFQEITTWVKENLKTEELTKLLLATDNKKRTVFHSAATLNTIEVFDGIYNLAKDNLTTEGLKKLFLAVDENGRTVFHMAANIYIKPFQGIFNLAKENLTEEEVTKLLLATDNVGRTVFHVAANSPYIRTFQGLSNLAKENLKIEELTKLLLATDNEGKTVFHSAPTLKTMEVFDGIYNFAKENLPTEELKKLLLATDKEGRTIFPLAGKSNKIEEIQTMLKIAY